jgi:hypothetical protein
MSPIASLLIASFLALAVPFALCGLSAAFHRCGPAIAGTLLTWSFLFFSWEKFFSQEFGFLPATSFTASTLFLLGSFVGMVFGGAHLLAKPHHADTEHQTT